MHPNSRSNRASYAVWDAFGFRQILIAFGARAPRAALIAFCALAAALLSLPPSARAQAMTKALNLSDPSGDTTPFYGHEIDAIAVNPETNKIYIATQNLNSPASPGIIAVLDGSTYKVLANISDSSSSAADQPYAIAINTVTNVIYVANAGGGASTHGSVTVIDGATDSYVKTFVDPAALDTKAVVVNPLTNLIYAANTGSNTISVFDGSSGPISITPTTTAAVATSPVALALNPAQNLLFVASLGAGTPTDYGTATVIDTTGVNSPITIVDPSAKGDNAVAVDVASGYAYVVNSGTNNVTVIVDTGGGVGYSFIHDTSAASNPNSIAVNPLTHNVYVSAVGNGAGSVSIFNSTTYKATITGIGGPNVVALDTASDIAYTGDDSGYIGVINGLTYSKITELSAGAGIEVVGVNPITHRVFAAADQGGGGPPGISVIDGATNVLASVNSTQTLPVAIAVNPTNNLIYVVNQTSDTVSIFNGNTDTDIADIPIGAHATAVAVNPITNIAYVAIADGGENYTYFNGSTFEGNIAADEDAPAAVVVNPVNNQIYGYDSGAPGFTLIDGASNTSEGIVATGSGNFAGMAINPVTDQIYVALSTNSTSSLLVMDGAGMFGYSQYSVNLPVNYGQVVDAIAVNPNTNFVYVATSSCNESLSPGSVFVVSGGGFTPPYEAAYSAVLTDPNATGGAGAFAVAVSPVTNMVYVANLMEGAVSVFSGAAGSTPGAYVTTIALSAGNLATSIAVNPVTNKIYATTSDNKIEVIDGVTNKVIDSISENVGSAPPFSAVNPITNQIFFANVSNPSLDVITEDQSTNPSSATSLTTSISTASGNQTANPAPTFTFNPTNNLPSHAAITRVYYQIDTWQGPWIQVPLASGSYTATTATLTPGYHIIFAYATAGEDNANTSSFSGLQSSPLIGVIASYGFVVNPAIAFLAPTSNTPSNSTTLTFPPTVYDQQSSTLTVTLTNEGGSPLQINEYHSDPDFNLETHCPSELLNPTNYLTGNTPCVISMAFQPQTTAGPITGSLTLFDDSYGSASQTITLTGNSIPIPPSITSEPSNPSSSSTAQFYFGTTINGVTGFQCQIDSGGYQPCNSGNVTYPGLNNASHTFNVEALDSVGDVSAPASYTWMVSASSTFMVTVNPLGNGTGAVSDGTTALDCAETAGNVFPPCSNSYSAPVTLTETPGADGSTFAGWGGACSGTATTCLVSSTATVTANFIPAPQMATLTYTTGSGMQTQQGTFDCGATSPPCPNPNAHNIQLAVQGVNSGFSVSVTATEIPPTMADGICESNNDMASGGVLTDFDCRFLNFFNYGASAAPAPAGTIVPLCYPYAHGNCIHYAINASSVPANAYLGPVNWKITWNNDLTAPTGLPGYWAGSTPQLYDDPDQAPTPLSAQGTDCTTAMTLGNGGSTAYACQFEFDITTFFDSGEPVDSGIGGSTKAFNDVVVAWPPTNAPGNTTIPLLNANSTPDSPSVTYGTGIGFTITLKNNGTTLASGITLNDPLPGGAAVNWVLASSTIPGCTISGTNPNQTLSCPAFSLAMGATDTIHVTSADAAAGVYTNVATFTIGTQRTLGVATVVVNGATSTLKFSPTSLNFGTVDTGGIALLSLTVTDTGASMVTFTNFSVGSIPTDDSSGYFGVEFCPHTLNPGKSCIIIMSFTADSSVTKTHAANLVIADNAPGSPQLILMSATVINPVASLSPSSLNFGSVSSSGGMSTKSATLKNSGTTPLILSGLSVSGTGFASATGASACTATTTLNPGATCLIYVTFKPTSRGLKSGSVRITDNALSISQYISLSGNGT